MTTLKNVLADITSDLKMYDEMGLIDDISLKLFLLNELKGFGGNVMEVYPHVLQIKNGQATLPDNFFSLTKAVKTSPIGCVPEADCNEPELINSYFYRVRKEASEIWDNGSKILEGDYKYVEEKTYFFNKDLKANFYYGNNTILKLVPGFDKSKLDLKCENVYVKSSPYHINIINNTLQTNFSNGFICIWYQGLLVDEEEEIILPEDPNKNIYKYLISTGKAKVFELVWANDDDANVLTKLQFYKGESQKDKTAALAQVRFNSITGENWDEGLKQRRDKRFRKFNNFGRG